MAVGRQNAACEESQSFASRMALSGDCGQLIDGYARFRADCIRPRLFRLSPQTRSESGRTSAATRVFKRKQTRPKLRRAFCAHRPGPRRRQRHVLSNTGRHRAIQILIAVPHAVPHTKAKSSSKLIGNRWKAHGR